MKLKFLKKGSEINEGIYYLTEIFEKECTYYTTWIEKKINEIKNFEKEVIALYVDENLIGYSMIHNCTEEYIKINAMYIFEEYKGNGYATEFLNLLVDDCKIKGYKYVLVQTRLNNNAVVRLFDKTGFNIRGTNFHQIECKDNWVAINDINNAGRTEKIIEILESEYPGFEKLNKLEIDEIIDSNKNNALILRVNKEKSSMVKNKSIKNYMNI